jgi:hypothetical protein
MNRQRLFVATIGYLVTLAVISLAMMTGYHGQVARRLDERTREVAVAHESVISTVAGAPELLHAQLMRDDVV